MSTLLHLVIRVPSVTGEKSFKCPHGKAAFCEDLALNKHMRIHPGEKPYKYLHFDALYRHKRKQNKHKKTRT